MDAVATIDPTAPAGPAPDSPPSPALLNASDLATLLNCSPKTIYRLNDRGALPRPIRLGAMLRWSRPVIERWIAEGCPVSQRRCR